MKYWWVDEREEYIQPTFDPRGYKRLDVETAREVRDDLDDAIDELVRVVEP